MLVQPIKDSNGLVVKLRCIFKQPHLLEYLLKELEMECIPNEVIWQHHTDCLDMPIFKLEYLLSHLTKISNTYHLKLWAINLFIIHILAKYISKFNFLKLKLMSNSQYTIFGIDISLICFKIIFIIYRLFGFIWGRWYGWVIALDNFKNWFSWL